MGTAVLYHGIDDILKISAVADRELAIWTFCSEDTDSEFNNVLTFFEGKG